MALLSVRNLRTEFSGDDGTFATQRVFETVDTDPEHGRDIDRPIAEEEAAALTPRARWRRSNSTAKRMFAVFDRP